jgi:hypothetical protein
MVLIVAGQRLQPGLAAPLLKKPEIGAVGPLGGWAPGRLFVPEGLLGGVKERVPQAERVQGDARGREAGSQGLDRGRARRQAGRQDLAFGVDPARNVRPYHRRRAQVAHSLPPKSIPTQTGRNPSKISKKGITCDNGFLS